MTLTTIKKAGLDELALDHVFTIGASGTDHYTFQGEGLNGTVNDPTLYLTRGKTYRFENGSGGHPIRIQSTSGASGTAYNTGVTNNAGSGTVIVEVQHDAPDVLYYQCTSHANMNGTIYVTGALADGGVTTAKIADDAVTADKLANSINAAIAANTAKDLTALSASNLTSGTIPDARLPATLPAISGANLTNLPASGKAHNLVINGAMQVAQRSTSSTTNGYGSVDRFRMSYSYNDESPTGSQVDVASGTTPYTLGFRKAFRITNGNQTSGANSQDHSRFQYKIEAQDIANSGWNYTSSSSYITLSFWVKSSVAQNFYGYIYAPDGTSQIYPYETGSLSADTWTKVTKTIAGNSNLTFNNDNGNGLQFELHGLMGTDYTDSGVSLNTWAAYASGTRTPDQTTTWYTTNDATLEITGVQLEVGDAATDFEHKSYADSLDDCLRYTYVINVVDGAYIAAHTAFSKSSTTVRGNVFLPKPMRVFPSYTGTATDAFFYAQNTGSVFHLDTITSMFNNSSADRNITNFGIGVTTSSVTAGQGGQIEGQQTGTMIFDAEL